MTTVALAPPSALGGLRSSSHDQSSPRGVPMRSHSSMATTSKPTPGSTATPPSFPPSNGQSGTSPDSILRRSRTTDGKVPNIQRAGPPPQITVKREPSSPAENSSSSRHRPRKLDLSKGSASSGAQTAALPSAGPKTSREANPMAMQEVGLACLSPGFQTQDPNLREQLQRSFAVRDHQREIIEARLNGRTPKTGEPSREDSRHDSFRSGDNQFFPSHPKVPATARLKKPAGLSIIAPQAEQFANERVIQSAPLNQSFPRHQMPLSRVIANQQHSLGATSHIHPQDNNNRLPPIADVFGPGPLGREPPPSRPSILRPESSSDIIHRGLPSPNTQLPHPPLLAPQRPREYASAEEAQARLSGGREDLLPKLVHYGGQQPPTPPSPHMNGIQPTPTSGEHPGTRNGTSRRRARADYERDDGPSLGDYPVSRSRFPFGEGRDSPEAVRRKKEEFLKICGRAWDLLHS